MSQVDLDHTSFAVHDARAGASRLRRDLGATPIAGETLAQFRYLLMHVGGPHDGGRLELLEPTGPGFLQRFLEQRGEGPHHITFTVPDLRATLAAVQALGLAVLGEDLTHKPWQEAFIVPDRIHGIVVQLAETDRSFPSPPELLATRERSTASFPSNRDATDPQWWTAVWNTHPTRRAVLGPTHLGSTDLSRSRRLFGEVLGAHLRDLPAGRLVCSWPSGSLVVHPAASAGVTGIEMLGGPRGGLRIGPTPLGGSFD